MYECQYYLHGANSAKRPCILKKLLKKITGTMCVFFIILRTLAEGDHDVLSCISMLEICIS